MKRKVSLFQNTIIYFINAILTAILGVVINKLFALYIDPAEYGIYSIVHNMFSLVVSIVFMVFTNSILRYYSEYKTNEKLDNLYASVIKLIFLLGIVYIVGIGVAIPLLSSIIDNKTYYSLIVLFAILFMPEGLREICVSFARCQGKAKRQTITSVIRHLVKLLVFLLVFFGGNQSVESIVYGAIVSTVVSLLFYLDCWHIPKNWYSIKSSETSKKLLQFGIPLIGIPVVNYLLSTSDQLIINFFCGEHDTGLYSMGYKIATNLFSVVTTFLITSSHHIIMDIYDQGRKNDAEVFLSRFAFLYWLICIPLLFEIIAFRKYFMLLFASESYLSSSFVLAVSSMGIIFTGYVRYTNKAWEVSKKSWMIAVFSGIGALVNVFLNFIFVPTYGYEAAAVTTIVSYLLVIMLSSIFGKKYLRIIIPRFKMILLALVGVCCLALACVFETLFVSNILTFILFAGITAILYIVVVYVVFKKDVIAIVNMLRNIEG